MLKPVDQTATMAIIGYMNIIRTLAAIGICFPLAATGVAAEKVATEASISTPPMFTQSKPAVDGLNGELWIYGGAGMGNAQSMSTIPGLAVFRDTGRNLQAIGGVTGVITAPVGHDFGFQLDLNTGTFETAIQGSAAGHFFWRDPEKGLVGIYGAASYWANYGGKSIWNIGPEIEKYFDQLTIGGTAGAQGFSFYNVTWDPTVPLNDQRTPCNHQPLRFFDNVSFKYYPTDDLMLLVGHTYTKGNHAARFGAEYIPEQFRGGATAASLFVDGTYGWNKSSTIMGGLKVYFGNSDKSLKRRHREDDPPGSAGSTNSSCSKPAYVATAEDRARIAKISPYEIMKCYSEFGNFCPGIDKRFKGMPPDSYACVMKNWLDFYQDPLYCLK